jgi:aminopeptidase N
MKSFRSHLFIAFVPLYFCLCVPSAIAQEVFPVRDEGEARDRLFDVLHYRIEVSFDEPGRTVSGKVTTTLIPFPAALNSVEFDAEEMLISRVSLAGGRSLAFEVKPRTVVIRLDRSYSYSDTLAISIEYSCTPRKGLYFVLPDSGYPGRPAQIWTQGEDMDNHFWFPCYDFPNDRATSEVLATVRRGLTVLSNGRLLKVTENKSNGTTTYHWKQSKPHVAYLVMLAIGEYAVLRDKAGRVPLEYYVYPHNIEDAKVCFEKTPDMIRFFNTTTGITYPWDKYAQVLIRDFVVGGMENTSATSLADESAVFDARARLDHSPTSLIAHELSHQWWGDLLTCKDWRHLWLNESFASYFDPLYHEHLLGRDHFDYTMYEAQKAGINSDRTMGRKPIVSTGSFGANVYPRGASVLHMLRFQLGEDLFWRAIRHYITKFQYATVETRDFETAIEEVTGQNLYWFFDQWVYKAGYPVFAVSYTWSDSAKTLSLSVQQTQKLDSLTGIFRTPVDVEVVGATGSTVHRVQILNRDTLFVLPAPERPRLVIFDKGNWILKELRFEKADDEWRLQLAEAANPVDRLRAIGEIVTNKPGGSFIQALITSAARDPFPEVRREAINALSMVSGDTLRTEVKTVYLAAARDMSPGVRRAALAQLADSGDAECLAAIKSALSDSSYAVVAQALRSLAETDKQGSLPILRAHLSVPSYRDGIASAALAAMANVDSTAGIAESRMRIRYGNPQSIRFAALGILRRFVAHGTVSAEVFEDLLADAQVQIRNSAIRILGEFGDARVVPRLEAIAADKHSPSAGTAKAGVARLKKRLELQTGNPK